MQLGQEISMEFTSLRRVPILKSFEKAITTEIEYSQKVVKFKASVGIVIRLINNQKQILLGKCVLKDDREGLWCFPGGGIEQGENTYQAGIREVKEETNISVRPIYSPVIMDEDMPGVAFIQFEYLSGEPVPNHEYEDLKWFPMGEVPKEIYPQNKRILDFVKTLPIVIEKKKFVEEHEKLLKVLKKRDEGELEDEYKEQKQEFDTLVKGKVVSDLFQKAKELPIGTINKWKEMKMPDGTWKYVGDQGKDHHAVKHLFESGEIKQTYQHLGKTRGERQVIEPIYTLKPGGGILFTPTGDPKKSFSVELQEIDPDRFIRFKMDDGTVGTVDLRKHRFEERFIADSYEPPIKPVVITVEKQEASPAQKVSENESVRVLRGQIVKNLTPEVKHQVASYLENLPSQTILNDNHKKQVSKMLGINPKDETLQLRWVASNGYVDDKMIIVLYGEKKLLDGVTPEGLRKKLGLIKQNKDRNLFKISKGNIDYDF